ARTAEPHHHVEPPVAVHVREHQRPGLCRYEIIHARPKTAVAFTQADRNSAVQAVRYRNIGNAVPVEIARRDLAWTLPGGVRYGRLKTPPGIAQKTRKVIRAGIGHD